MFEYPLTLKFETKDEHTKHVLDYQSFYTTILNRCVNDTNEVYLLESQLEVAKKEAEEAKKNDEESKKKVKESKRKEEIARKEAEEAKKKDEESRKQAEESKRKEEIARKEADEAKKKDEESRKENKALEEKVKHADLLIEQKRKNDLIESSGKGKTFESQIVYALKSDQKLMGMCKSIEESAITKACDIRLDVFGLGRIGIEAKNKKKITKQDIEKFERDILINDFKGSIFWSQTAAIPYLSVRNQNEDFFHIEEKVLYIRSSDFQQSVKMIYVYLLCLKTSQAIPGDKRQFKDFIIKMFDMLRRHYNSFQKLRKEVQNLDEIMFNDIENIESMCQQELHFELKPIDMKRRKAMESISNNGKKKKACQEVVAIDDSSNGIMNGTGEEVVAMDDETIQSDHIVTSGDQKFSG